MRNRRRFNFETALFVLATGLVLAALAPQPRQYIVAGVAIVLSLVAGKITERYY